MLNRLQVQTTLKSVVTNVYFQPPESIKIQYPCVVYSLNGIDSIYADDNVYKLHDSYMITYITKKADDTKVEELAMIPKIRYDRLYTSDGLYHHVYTLKI